MKFLYSEKWPILREWFGLMWRCWNLISGASPMLRIKPNTKHKIRVSKIKFSHTKKNGNHIKQLKNIIIITPEWNIKCKTDAQLEIYKHHQNERHTINKFQRLCLYNKVMNVKDGKFLIGFNICIINQPESWHRWISSEKGCGVGSIKGTFRKAVRSLYTT